MHILAFWPGGAATWFEPVSMTGQGAVSKLVLHKTASRPLPKGPAVPASSCYFIQPTTLHGVPVTVGYKSNVKADISYSEFKYTASASQSTGVAVSYTGGYQSWTGSGSITTSASTSSSFSFDKKINGGPGNNDFQTATTWLEGQYTCGGIAPYSDYEAHYQTANTYLGSPGAAAIAAGDCSPEGTAPVSYYTMKQSTREYGVDLSNSLGIKLTSQDGWETHSELTYSLSVPGAICGVNNWPNNGSPSPGILTTH